MRFCFCWDLCFKIEQKVNIASKCKRLNMNYLFIELSKSVLHHCITSHIQSWWYSALGCMVLLIN